MEEIELQIKNVCKNFMIDKKKREIIKNIDINVKKGEFVSIVGSSGCGKSTLLRIIAGLETVSSGQVLLEGTEVAGTSPRCKMAFQEARLLPWWSVEKNISFGIGRKVDEEEKDKLVAQYINLVGLNGFEKALPRQLSGGMQQRVSIARALISDPKLLLLDEPFGALDALTKINMQKEVLKIWESEKKTMILVTHDIEEAVYLSDRVIVLSERPGEIKNIINIDIGRPRKRGSHDFSYFTNLIYKEFFTEVEREVEYSI